MRKSGKDVATLTDRFGIALLCGLTAFVTGAFIWLFIFFFLAKFGSFDSELLNFKPSFAPVLVFTVVMALLGFATQLNFIAIIFGAIWNGVYKVIRLIGV